MFFTDGQPNCGRYSTQQSIVENLKIYKEEANFQYPIHTYAFGQYTNCTSDLLYQIADMFDGMFGYIQDAKTVGTIFINGIAYTLCTAANSFLLQVSIDDKVITPCHHWNEGSFGSIKLPSLRYGQSTDILFNLKGLLKADSKVRVTYSAQHKGKLNFPMEKELHLEKCQVSENEDHQMRFETVKLFKKILNDFKPLGVEGLHKDTKLFVE